MPGSILGLVPGPAVANLDVVQGSGQTRQFVLPQLGKQDAVPVLLAVGGGPDDLAQKLHGLVVVQLDLDSQDLVLLVDIL